MPTADVAQNRSACASGRRGRLLTLQRLAVQRAVFEFQGDGVAAGFVLTGFFVYVILGATDTRAPKGFAPLAIGLALTLIHLVAIPVDNTSVNPARSFGTAIFSGSDALVQLWAFIIFPLIGGALGFFIWLLVHDERLEDTMLGGQKGLLAARDRAAGMASSLDDRLR